MNGLLFGVCLILIALGLENEQIAWWEIPIPIITSYFIFLAFREWAIERLTSDVRYVYSYIVSATRMLEWVEEIHYVEYEYDGTDEKGNPKYKTVNKVRYEHHPERWFATDGHGNEWGLGDYEDFMWYCNRFGEPEYSDTSHSGQYSGGGMYETTWPETDFTLWPVSFNQNYENRGQATANVYQYRKLNDFEIAKVYPYPNFDNWITDAVLLPKEVEFEDFEKDHVRMLWAKLGVTKDVTPWILVFKNESINVSILQETFWARGNDNDFVLCVGINDDNQILWARVFSWSADNVLEAEVAHKVQQFGMFDIYQIADLLYEKLQKYELPDFEKMFGHIRVEVPLATLLWSSLVALLVGLPILYWILVNDFTWIVGLEQVNNVIEWLSEQLESYF